MYYYGRGVQQDYTAAATWFRKAAEQGHAYAQYSLGWVYWKRGRSNEAKRWWREAADQGHASAQRDLRKKF